MIHATQADVNSKSKRGISVTSQKGLKSSKLKVSLKDTRSSPMMLQQTTTKVMKPIKSRGDVVINACGEADTSKVHEFKIKFTHLFF